MNLAFPPSVRERQPITTGSVLGTPLVEVDDHRWTLVPLYAAARAGRITLPVTLLSFDRHRDALVPEAGDSLPDVSDCDMPVEEFADIVAEGLSPRDDDWLLAGMEMGVIGNAVQFGVDEEALADGTTLTVHRDGRGDEHRIFHGRRLKYELSFMGALTDRSHPHAGEGMWETLGWHPDGGFTRPAHDPGFAVDIDLDVFTFAWDTYVFPYPDKVWKGEYGTPCQSGDGWSVTSAVFVRDAIRRAGMVTVAHETEYCGGGENAAVIREAVERYLFGAE